MSQNANCVALSVIHDGESVFRGPENREPCLMKVGLYADKKLMTAKGSGL
jgi:hypothetical protein